MPSNHSALIDHVQNAVISTVLSSKRSACLEKWLGLKEIVEGKKQECERRIILEQGKIKLAQESIDKAQSELVEAVRIKDIEGPKVRELKEKADKAIAKYEAFCTFKRIEQVYQSKIVEIEKSLLKSELPAADKERFESQKNQIKAQLDQHSKENSHFKDLSKDEIIRDKEQASMEFRKCQEDFEKITAGISRFNREILGNQVILKTSKDAISQMPATIDSHYKDLFSKQWGSEENLIQRNLIENLQAHYQAYQPEEILVEFLKRHR